MVKNIKDEEVQKTHNLYDDWESWQYIADLHIGDKIKIEIEPIDGSGTIEKEFIAKYINCHINCRWQDKGVRKDYPL